MNLTRKTLIRYAFNFIFRKKLLKKAYMYRVSQGMSYEASFEFAKKEALNNFPNKNLYKNS
jgi:hypothetical protein